MLVLTIAGGIVLGFFALSVLSQPGVLEGLWEAGKLLLLVGAVIALLAFVVLSRR